MKVSCLLEDELPTCFNPPFSFGFLCIYVSVILNVQVTRICILFS